ncbi:DUF6138 family protein [Lysinibacillus sp. ZYM-1]|uniref:DUF6138 family protein n=1 Tax=Lysinibacillus sp. ZYM-1 TaxID=1681184 RepID=UPI0006CE754E|nr:DUF6138 family protein [Lysinibacillus sp. ZYM-1]KPN96242.1 hypothetical protein AO843_18200 [Lysinibacillus sp. ZYM-1]
MKQSVENFLADVWEKLTAVYQQESQRISAIQNQSRLQAGIFNYLKVAWKKGQSQNGTIYIDVYEPFSWSDSAYKVDAGTYIQEFTEKNQVEELFSALSTKMERMFQAQPYGPRFFDYHFQVMLEFEHGETIWVFQKELLHEHKLAFMKQELASFIQTKVLAELPVRPSDNDEFFFAQHLVNPHFFQQTAEEIEPLVRQLQEKHLANKERLDQWIYYYTTAFKNWAEDHFLKYHFEQAGDYTNEWVPKTEDTAQDIEQEKLDFFLYVTVKLGYKEPATRLQYLKLAKQLGSQQAIDYLQKGSGRFESMHKSDVFEGRANDILQTIDLRMKEEGETAYREALHYIIHLLQEGFPKGYNMTLKAKVKNFLPLKKLAKSKLHQFFANCLAYPSLFPLLADYAQIAMEEFTWYQDVEPSEKSAMPGTYAVFGLGLYSKDYFPLVLNYMALVDSEHQSVQDSYGEAFVEAHGLSTELIPVFVAILLGANESAKPLKGIEIMDANLLKALVQELEDKEDYEREFVLYRLFGSPQKLRQRMKQEATQIKEELEKLRQWIS